MFKMFRRLRTNKNKKFYQVEMPYYLAFVDLIEKTKNDFWFEHMMLPDTLFINPKYLKCLLPFRCYNKIRKVAGLNVIYSHDIPTFVLAITNPQTQSHDNSNRFEYTENDI